MSELNLKTREHANTEHANTVVVPRRCSVKKVFLKISQNFQENTCARVSFLIKRDSGIGVFL